MFNSVVLVNVLPAHPLECPPPHLHLAPLDSHQLLDRGQIHSEQTRKHLERLRNLLPQVPLANLPRWDRNRILLGRPLDALLQERQAILQLRSRLLLVARIPFQTRNRSKATIHLEHRHDLQRRAHLAHRHHPYSKTPLLRIQPNHLILWVLLTLQLILTHSAREFPNLLEHPRLRRNPYLGNHQIKRWQQQGILSAINYHQRRILWVKTPLFKKQTPNHLVMPCRILLSLSVGLTLPQVDINREALRRHS